MRLFFDIFAVEAYTASWIEIAGEGSNKMDEASKPIRLRGLKYTLQAKSVQAAESRSLYGFVD